MGAVRILGTEEKMYVVTVLNRVAQEVPVAGHLAAYILECELEPEARKCFRPRERVYGALKDTEEGWVRS